MLNVNARRRYQQILKLVPTIEQANHGCWKLEADTPGIMDLTIEILHRQAGVITIAMAHNWVLNGDVMADPDMEIQLFTGTAEAEALAFQQDGVPNVGTVYHRADQPGSTSRAKLNEFLDTWLKNIESQGHRLPTVEEQAFDSAEPVDA